MNMISPSQELSAAPAYPGQHLAPVTWVHHWTDRLFSFRSVRPSSFRFRSGEFVMIGLPGETKPLMRAYSVASPYFADEIEFFSIKVPDGRFTSRLQQIRTGDDILLGKKPTGSLTIDALKPGKNLFLLSTGTGLAPWLSIARDPDTYDRFEKIIVVHGVRWIADLAYRELFEHEILDDPLVGDRAADQLVYTPCVTRDPFQRTGRITDRILNGALFRDVGLARTMFNVAEDRVMLCGSMEMIKETAVLLEQQGLVEGSNANPGDYVLERAFVG